MSKPVGEIRLLRHSRRRGRADGMAAKAALPLRVLTGFKGVLAGLIVVGGTYLAIANYGAPAMQYSYDYRLLFGQERFKTKCRYISPYGTHERAARGGRCAWIVLVKKGKS